LKDTTPKDHKIKNCCQNTIPKTKILNTKNLYKTYTKTQKSHHKTNQTKTEYTQKNAIPCNIHLERNSDNNGFATYETLIHTYNHLKPKTINPPTNTSPKNTTSTTKPLSQTIHRYHIPKPPEPYENITKIKYIPLIATIKTFNEKDIVIIKRLRTQKQKNRPEKTKPKKISKKQNETQTNICQQPTIVTKITKKQKIKPLKENIASAPNIKKTPPSPKYGKKIKEIINTKNNTPKYTFHNKKILLKYGDIESNPGPRPTLFLNHPQIHLEKQKTYFYYKTTQIKPEYNHILEQFKPYLNSTQNTNINPNLTQFCRNNNHCPENYLFYAILITLAPTSTQCNQLIAGNSIQWTTNLIKNLIECPNPLPTDQYKLIKFHLENINIIKPLESIQKELYSFITTEQPNMATTQHKLPCLPEKMIIEALKCLQPIPNFTHPNPIQNHPPINPQLLPTQTQPLKCYHGTVAH
jgi:hypothetical protein